MSNVEKRDRKLRRQGMDLKTRLQPPRLSWKDLAQAAYEKQLAPKEKTPVSEGLQSTDRSPVRENGLTKA